MSDYTDSTAVDKMLHPNNTVRFKSDIHTIFDSKRFAIVPADRRLVAYCLNARPGSQIARVCHGVELHRLTNPPELLFARFAYTVFENLRDFLDTRVERKLRLWARNDWVIEICDSERCQQFSRATASQGKSRSVSPEKRTRIQEEEEMETVEDDDRGRKRRRGNESLTWQFAGSISGDSSTCFSEDKPVATPEDLALLFEPKFNCTSVDSEFDVSRHTMSTLQLTRYTTPAEGD